ncbi:phage tail protein [Escherichia sp. E4385]|uniref:phage tail protein n=1 Tax=Escherichia sp. E4385 TaxID=2040639 RepID=UPI00107F1FF3|nr:phage tail protein [Escherichia sp. E4385]TGC15417.1 phage tail protein [Escherichia sp. E4385]TLI98880.1 phage tail protein [Escherichia sp. E4385]
MTAKYFAILTNQGAARLANAAALGTKLNLTQMAVGDANGTLPTPDPAQTKLINQKRIAPLNLLTVDPANTSQIIAEQIIPENEGGFWIREIGLYDDAGVLIAVANCPETYKPQLQEGSGRTQTIRMILIVSSTSAITLKIDPSVVLATRQYVDDKVIEVKSYADGLMRAHEQSRNHPDATTTAKGFTQLNSSVTDDRETQSATPKAVKIAMDNANARLAKERNLSDLPNPALARQNLQLGDSSTKNTGTTANTVAAGDDTRITGAMQKSQNGEDIQDVAKFLQNLGLKDAAKRQVGTADLDYIPDMSSFQSEIYWQKLPGKLIQWVAIPPHDGDQVITLPIPFPGRILGFAVGAGYEPTSGRITTFAINVGAGPTSTIISRASDFISGGSCILIGY